MAIWLYSYTQEGTRNWASWTLLKHGWHYMYRLVSLSTISPPSCIVVSHKTDVQAGVMGGSHREAAEDVIIERRYELSTVKLLTLRMIFTHSSSGSSIPSRNIGKHTNWHEVTSTVTWIFAKLFIHDTDKITFDIQKYSTISVLNISRPCTDASLRQ